MTPKPELPEWINEHWESYDHEICGGKCPLREALSIAWEALRIISICPRTTVGFATDTAQEAIEHIKSLGEGK